MRVPDVSKDDSSNSNNDSWGDSKDESDDDHKEDENDDEDGNDDDNEEEQYEEFMLTPERNKSDDDDKMYEEKDDDVAKELYGDLNITQGLRDTDMTNAQQGGEDQLNASHESGFVQEEENAHVTLITVHDKTKALFQFDQRVSTLETKVFEFNQTSQFAEAVSLIPSIVNNYLASKLKEEILIDKMETNKSINKLDTQKNLYNALIEAYNSDKDIFTSYGDVVTLKRGRDDQDKDEDPSAGSDRGRKRRKSCKDFEPLKAQGYVFKEMHEDQGNESGHIDDQPDNKATPMHDWFQKPDKSLTLDRAWNKSKSVDFRPPQNGSAPSASFLHFGYEVSFEALDKEKQPPRTFNELIGTPIDFSAYVMNCIKIENLTQEILVGPAFSLLNGTCKSFAKLEFYFKECYKAFNIHADYFINNDLEYLKGGSLSSIYATSTTITKDAKYENIEGIEDMVPRLWSPVKVAYNKHAVYVKVMRWYDYGYLEEIVVRKDDNVLYKFKKGDFPKLNLRDIEDMLLLLVQKKLSNLDVDDRTLSSVRFVLLDIASNLDLDYLPKRRWSNLEIKRSCIMVKVIDKLLFERRLIHNLEKFVGGRDYENDLRLLD
nr:hypothetical protein [Tanacetum cinerariifolium]